MKPRKSDRFFNVLLTLVGVVLLVVLGFSFNASLASRSQQILQTGEHSPPVHQLESATHSPPVVVEQPSSTPADTAPATTDPTVGWKTFTNDTVGYSISYPPNYEMGSCARTFCPSLISFHPPGVKPTDEFMQILEVADKPQSLSYEAHFQQLANSIYEYEIKSKNLTTNMKSPEYQVVYQDSVGGEIEVIFKSRASDGKTVQITLTSSKGESLRSSTHYPVFQLMLSSFNFH